MTDDMLVEVLKRHAVALPIVLFSDRPESEVQGLVARTGARGAVPKDGASLSERLKPYLES